MADNKNIQLFILRLKDEVSRAAGKARGSLANLQAGISRLGPSLLKVGAILAGVGASLLAVAKSSAAYADEIGKAAQITGVGTEALSAFRHAAELGGVSFEEFQSALIRFSTNIVDFQNGTGTAKESLEALDIELNKQDGTLKSNEELFTDVAEAISKLEDGIQKTAIAYAIFGRVGAKLIPVMNGGG